MTQKNNSKSPWRKRILITFLALFTLYLCVGIWVVPGVMVTQIQKLGSEALGRDVSISEATFNPLSLEAKLYEIKVGPEEGESGDLLTIGKVAVNPQLSSVFGTIVIKTIEISDGDIWVEKDSSGSFNFQDILDAQPATPEVPEEDANAELPALVVKNVTLANLSTHFKDSSLETAYEEALTIVQFNGRDLGTVEKSGIGSEDTEEIYHWDFDVALKTQSGATLAVDGGAKSITPWEFEIAATLEGFPIESARSYIEESLVATIAGYFDLNVRALVSLGQEEPLITVSGSMGIDDFSVIDAEQRFVEIPRLAVNEFSLDVNSMAFTLESLFLEKPVFEAILLGDGSPRLPKMKEARPSVQTASAETAPATPFSAKIGSVSISEGRIDFEDRSTSEIFVTSIESVNLSLQDLKMAQGEDDYDASGSMQLAMELLGGNLLLKSSFEGLESKMQASLSLEDLSLSQLQNYVSEFVYAQLNDGSLSLDASVEMLAFENPKVMAEFRLNGLDVSETARDRHLFSLQDLSVSGVEFAGDSVQISSIKFVEPLVTIWQDDEGLNFDRIQKFEQQTEQTVQEFEEDTGLIVDIEDFEIEGAGVDFMDTDLISTYKSRISEFGLRVVSFSTRSEQVAEFDFSGKIDGSARLRGKGALTAADPSKMFDVETSFLGYDLTATSPYWETFLGRGLSKGQFEIRSSYSVRDNQLSGTNDFKIDQLTLGERADSDRAINLPLGFAIGLMQDPSGMIEYDGLKVEGDLSDPQVKPWGLVGRAIRNLILNAVASPFKFLAGVVGSPDNLDTIRFASGSLELDEAAGEKIQSLQKMLTQRPGLKIELTFKADPAEELYLKSQYEKHLLANPNFEVVSGLDLLTEVDSNALEVAVEEMFLALEKDNSEGGEDPMVTAEPPVSESQSIAEKSPGLIKRLKSAIGLSKEETVKEPEPIVTESPVLNDVSDAEEIPSLTFDEKLALVLKSQPAVSVESEWLVDLAGERIRIFKEALLADGTLESSRVFATNLTEEDAKRPAGALLVKITD